MKRKQKLKPADPCGMRHQSAVAKKNCIRCARKTMGILVAKATRLEWRLADAEMHNHELQCALHKASQQTSREQALQATLDSVRHSFTELHKEKMDLEKQLAAVPKMSRRDEFAAAALTGLLASDRDGRISEGDAAYLAVKFADTTIRSLDGAGGV